MSTSASDDMIPVRDNAQSGLYPALLAAFLFGVSTPLAKGLLRGLSPQILAGLFYLGSGVGLASLALLGRGANLREAPLKRNDIPWLSGAVVFGGIIAPVLLLTGLQNTPSSNASLLLNLESVLTVALAWIAFHENAGRRFALGMSAIVLGGVLISWQGISLDVSILGPLAIAGACLCWAIDNNLTQKVSAGDPVEVAAIKGLVAGTVNLLLGLLLASAWPAAVWSVAAIVVGFFSYGLSLMFFVSALRAIGTARTGAYFSTAPFIGAGLGILMWGEPLTPSFVGASILMASGAWFLLTEQHKHLHAHEPFVHAHNHVHDMHHQHERSPNDPPGEPHSHPHEHRPLVHFHPHYPDIHHRHAHSGNGKTV